MRKKMIAAILTIMVATTFTGCGASIQNGISKQGGLFTASKADYVVVKQSGGKITDVYKLKNSYVESEKNSDGMSFIDGSGNSVILQGDCKIIRCSDSKTWDMYREYHSDLEAKEYIEIKK